LNLKIIYKMTYKDEFPFIDHPETPKVIKPMTILHDKLVKGYMEDRDLIIEKLIKNMQKSITKQISALVDLEEEVNEYNVVLVRCLERIRKLVDSRKLPEDIHNEMIEFLFEQTNELAKNMHYGKTK
tara:strand:- start:181 stop:561 length:381 start_codon:yes stop_codon:yes gene_type:complete